MDETARMVQQMRQVVEGEAWHGPSLREVLQGLSAASAASRSIPGAHSIWEIMLHLRATQELMLRRLAGNAAPLTPVEDWPALPEPDDDPAWRATVEDFARGEEQLRRAVSELPEARLERPLVEGGSSAYDNVHGYVQHVAYHAGQMILLKRGASDRQR
jgi:uncharacterized damage-inducible protein DinB